MRRSLPSLVVLVSVLIISLALLAALPPSKAAGIAYSTAWVTAGALLVFGCALVFRGGNPFPRFQISVWCGVVITWLAFVLYQLRLKGPVRIVYFMGHLTGPYGIQPFGIPGGVLYMAVNILGWAAVSWLALWAVRRRITAT